MVDYDTMKPVELADAVPGTAVGLSDDELQDLNLLREKLRKKERRNTLRSNYYDGKNRLKNMGISIPPSLTDIETVVGWPAKAVDALEARLNRNGFILPGQDGMLSDIERIYDLNNMQVESSTAHTAALTHGTSFAFVTKGDEAKGDPPVVIAIRSARQATAIYNRRRRAIDIALEVIVDDEHDTRSDRWVILHRRDSSITMRRDDREWVVEDRSPNSLGINPCVPFIHRPFIERTFGQSRITRAVMSHTDTAVRTVLRTEISAEFYGAPQRYLLGADEGQFTDKDGNVKTGWETILGRMLAIPHPEPDEDQVGETKPITAGQFPQQSMVPHTEHLRSTAMLFSGETGIPVGQLGIIHDNPSSADAIKAGEIDLISIAERDHLTLGSGHCNVGRLTIYTLEGNTRRRDDLAKLRSRWRNAGTPTRQAEAQAAAVLVGQGTLLPRSPVTYEYLGFDEVTMKQLAAEDRRMAADQALARLTAAAAAQQGQTGPAGQGGSNSQSTQNANLAARPDVPDQARVVGNGATR